MLTWEPFKTKYCLTVHSYGVDGGYCTCLMAVHHSDYSLFYSVEFARM